MGYPEVRKILEKKNPNIDELLAALDFLATDRGYLLCLVSRGHLKDVDGMIDSRAVLVGLVKAKIGRLVADLQGMILS